MCGCKLRAKFFKSPYTDNLDSITSNATIGETFFLCGRKELANLKLKPWVFDTIEFKVLQCTHGLMHHLWFGKTVRKIH